MPEERSHVSGEITDLVEVGRYPLRTRAQERALVILAMDIGYWLFPEGHEYVLCVRAPDASAVRQELERFEAELLAKAEHPPVPPRERPRHKLPSLFVFAWFLAACFLLQGWARPEWVQRGVAENGPILSGEWWRCITALTLHGDLGHLLANTAAGLLFAAFLVPELGGGLTWFLVLLSGVVGNAINAWGYRGEAHASIGASTAVFGALGALTGVQIALGFIERRAPRLREVLIPLGGGLSLLALLGTGSEHALERIDQMAHLWGFVAGIPLGAIAAGFRWGERVSIRAQWLLGIAAVLLPVAAWIVALRSIFFSA